MRAYRTLDQLEALKGALRTFDLLGQLPVRELTVPVYEPLHDFTALADDWKAVAEDVHAAVRLAFDDREIREALEQLHHHEIMNQLTELRTRFEELAESARKYSDEIEHGQMRLFDREVDEKAG
jgi:hypothetical protein